MAKVVIKLGRTPLTPTHQNLLRRFISDALDTLPAEPDFRADARIVSNKAAYIADSYRIPCSDISNPLLPQLAGYNVTEIIQEVAEDGTVTETEVTHFVKACDTTSETDTSNPIYEYIVYSTERDEEGNVVQTLGPQQVTPFEMSQHDFLIVMGHIADFPQADINRSNVLVLTY